VYIKVYGSRGSMPFFSRDNVGFGGNTSCIRVETNGRTIILDAGSGLLQFSRDVQGQRPDVDILLGHLHLDHTIGLPMYAPLWSEDCRTRIWTKPRGEGTLVSQVFGSFCPPYWPVALADISRARMMPLETDKAFMLGDNVRVTATAVPHYDDTTAFRIEGDKTLVYLVDCEVTDSGIDRLAAFCRNADIIVFDASYLPCDTGKRQGFGHSTYEAGLALAEKSGCKQMLFTHLNPEYGDAALHAAAKTLEKTRHQFAFDGMEMVL